MKKIVASLLILLLIISTSLTIFASNDEVSVYLDNVKIEFDVPAQIINGRTMVPVRKIFEELGMTVNWDGETQKVSADKKGVLIELTINDTTIYRNSIEQTIDVPAQIIDGRTLVPVRVVSEYAGAEVSWDGTTSTVYINSTDNVKYINWNDSYEYWGEIKNSVASGYGMLYNKADNSIAQMGLYVDSKIVKGTDLYSDGEYFAGDFQNGKWHNGTFHYKSGDSYVGDFVDSQRHGEGTYLYKDGSFHKGKWENNQPNGYGIFYDSVEDVQYQGNFIDGKKVGNFLIDDFYENKSYRVSYDDNSGKDTNNTQSQNQTAYESEYNALIAWAEEKTQEIYTESQKIYDETYEKKLKEAYAMYGIDSNSDPNSFAYSNAMRQVNAMMPNIKAAAVIEKEAYEAEELETLAYYLQTKINELKTKYNIKD